MIHYSRNLGSEVVLCEVGILVFGDHGDFDNCKLTNFFKFLLLFKIFFLRCLCPFDFLPSYVLTSHTTGPGPLFSCSVFPIRIRCLRSN